MFTLQFITTAKLQLWGSNEIMLWLGSHPAWGTALKGGSVRKVGNHCSRAKSSVQVSLWAQEAASPHTNTWTSTVWLRSHCGEDTLIPMPGKLLGRWHERALSTLCSWRCSASEDTESWVVVVGEASRRSKVLRSSFITTPFPHPGRPSSQTQFHGKQLEPGPYPELVLVRRKT